MADWLSANVKSISIWCGAVSTFAIYSVLYAENRLYRLFEHIFIGLAAGFGVYITWSQVLAPKWWQPMVLKGHWYWAFAAVLGSMFYFMYSRKHAWISRVIFGLFMGLSAGLMFRDLYEIYFPQMGASMKPLLGKSMSVWATLNVIVFYVILLCSMSYFFFSFEHANPVIKRSAAAGRWFLMIGFGAIFGSTVMGRMTLFIGRVNFLLNDWRPEVATVWRYPSFKAATIAIAFICLALIGRHLWFHHRMQHPSGE
ncbi:MAG: hypothetical protein N3B12_08200 [Armatimonadetes bacterium]|nr:hypothetical protein [Armatimonadota bacterium]